MNIKDLTRDKKSEINKPKKIKNFQSKSTNTDIVMKNEL